MSHQNFPPNLKLNINLDRISVENKFTKFQLIHIVEAKKKQVVLNALKTVRLNIFLHSNMTSFFCFANKQASYPFGIISFAHAPMNVTDFSISSMNCVRHFPQR